VPGEICLADLLTKWRLILFFPRDCAGFDCQVQAAIEIRAVFADLRAFAEIARLPSAAGCVTATLRRWCLAMPHLYQQISQSGRKPAHSITGLNSLLMRSHSGQGRQNNAPQYSSDRFDVAGQHHPTGHGLHWI